MLVSFAYMQNLPAYYICKTYRRIIQNAGKFCTYAGKFCIYIYKIYQYFK